MANDANRSAKVLEVALQFQMQWREVKMFENDEIKTK